MIHILQRFLTEIKASFHEKISLVACPVVFLSIMRIYSFIGKMCNFFGQSQRTVSPS